MALRLEDVIAEIKESRKESAAGFRDVHAQIGVLQTTQATQEQKCTDRGKTVDDLTQAMWGSSDGRTKGVQRKVDTVEVDVSLLQIRLGRWSKLVWVLFTAFLAFLARMFHSAFSPSP